MQHIHDQFEQKRMLFEIRAVDDHEWSRLVSKACDTCGEETGFRAIVGEFLSSSKTCIGLSTAFIGLAAVFIVFYSLDSAAADAQGTLESNRQEYNESTQQPGYRVSLEEIDCKANADAQFSVFDESENDAVIEDVTIIEAPFEARKRGSGVFQPASY